MDDIRGLKPFLFYAPSWKWVLGICLGLVCLFLLARLWRRRQRGFRGGAFAGPGAVAARSARAELDALRARGWIEQGRAREFHGSLSGILRAFLGTRFQAPGRKLTTSEWLALLSTQAMPAEVLASLNELLPVCDLVKFADAPTSAAEMEARWEAACAIVERLGDAVPPQDEAEGADESPAEAEAAEEVLEASPSHVSEARLDVLG